MAEVSRKRAERASVHVGPVFFDGEEALREVAKEDGLWNWALVGPDAKKLPLSGGGMGGVEEMREAVGNHAHSFGLLRMTFGVGARARTKFVLVHTSDSIDSGNFTSMQHGRALASKPEMQKVIRRFAAIAAEIHIQSSEDCTVAHVVGKLSGVVRGVEANDISVGNFEAAVAQHKANHPEVAALEQERKAQQKLAQQIAVPRPEALPPERESMPAAGPAGRLRRRMKLYAKGDMVEFLSNMSQRWLEGEVEEVATESREVSGHRIIAGSVRISFNNRADIEWIAPAEVETRIRPSPRPRAPAPVVGEMRQEMHGWHEQRHRRYFELSKGFLRWWDCEVSAKGGIAPSNTVYLLGLQQQRSGLDLQLRTTTSMGALYVFEAASEQETECWHQALWAHAGYCNDMREHAQMQKTSGRMREELLRLVSIRDSSRGRKTVAEEESPT